MLVYLSAPYSSIDNKKELMDSIMSFTGAHMIMYPYDHIVSPLFNHFTLEHVPALGGDYTFWKNYSRDLLRRCDKMIVLKFPGWDTSAGVSDEIEIAKLLCLPVSYLQPDHHNSFHQVETVV